MHTEYSLLDGVSRINMLPKAAADLGMKALAITDHGVMYGIPDFYKECKEAGIKPILGCEVYTAKGSRFDKGIGNGDYGHLILLAENDLGYKNLIKIVSAAFVDGFYYKPRIDMDLLRQYHEGIICTSACLAGDVPQAILSNNYERAKETALEFREIFGPDNYYLELQSNGLEEQAIVNKELIRMSKETGIPLVATNDVHYIKKEDVHAQDILLCVQTKARIDDEDRMRFNTDTCYLRSMEEMESLFSYIPEAIENTVKIAQRCNVTINDNERAVLPNYKVPDGMTPEEYLRKLTYEGAVVRYGDNIPKEAVDRIEYELGVISKMGYDLYYLIVWDFINYAKKNGIPVGPGRGSGAGSIVAYCVAITNIDPLRFNLAFERFLNPERISMPDFDVDFSDERRKEVIDYVVAKYGEDCTAQIITFGTFGARGVIRDVGRVLDLPLILCDRIAKMVPAALDMTLDKALETNPELKKEYDTNRQIKNLIDNARLIEGMPKNISTHAAGVVLTKDPVTSYVPVCRNGDNIVTQFPMGWLEKFGLLKVDFLGLKTLSVISNAVDYIRENHGVKVDFDNMDMDDKSVFKIISEGKTAGIFQLESAGMTRFMTELQPDCIEDIIAGIALFRPGPMDQIPRYLENKKHPNKIFYKTPLLEPILKVTYGCMIYQEQVMQIVRDLAGYTMGQSDLVRRAMAKKKLKVMQEERVNFVRGAGERGVPEDVANSIFDEMIDFASYAFNKSHAVCYAVVGYETAWLKRYYPAEFMCSLMNSTPEKIPEYIEECRKMGVKTLPPDVNTGESLFTVGRDGVIKYGLGAIKHLGEGAGDVIKREREDGGPFKGFADFCARISDKEINKRCVEFLIKAGACDGFGVYRSKMLATYDSLISSSVAEKRNYADGQLSLFGAESSPEISEEGVYPDIPELDTKTKLAGEKESLGFYISGHPAADYEDRLKLVRNIRTVDIIAQQEELAEDTGEYRVTDGGTVNIGGALSDVKVKVTKKKENYATAELSDIYGSVDLLIFPKAYEQYKAFIRSDELVFIKGKLSIREDESPKILVDYVSSLDNYLSSRKSVLEYTCDASKKKQLEAFVKYFYGKRDVVIKDKKTGEVLVKGYIDPEERVLSHLESIIG